MVNAKFRPAEIRSLEFLDEIYTEYASGRTYFTYQISNQTVMRLWRNPAKTANFRISYNFGLLPLFNTGWEFLDEIHTENALEHT